MEAPEPALRPSRIAVVREVTNGNLLVINEAMGIGLHIRLGQASARRAGVTPDGDRRFRRMRQTLRLVLLCVVLVISGCGAGQPPDQSPAWMNHDVLNTDVRLTDAVNFSTVRVTLGQTIGLRLHGRIGAVTDPRAAAAPGAALAVVAVAATGDELTAVYRAVRVGQAEIQIIAPCTGTGCAAAIRFRATVVVLPPASPPPPTG